MNSVAFIKKTTFFLLISSSLAVRGQQEIPSQIFETYKKDPVASGLPDFSYAGYRNGEKKLPNTAPYKIFNVLDFGAIPNDQQSDKEAIQAAISAANKNGSGIVFFPKGRFLVNEDSTAGEGIVSKGSRIVFRGSGSGTGGTELFMRYPLLPKEPDKMWTCPPMFTFTSGGKDRPISKVSRKEAIGSFTLQLSTTEGLTEGDWISVRMLNNAPHLIKQELQPFTIDTTWTYLYKKGVDVCLYFRVEKISGNELKLHAPLPYAIDPSDGWQVHSFAHAEEVWVEDIAFTGNFKEPFRHHSSWQHDSGFSLFFFVRCTDSWMRNCVFTDCSVAAIVNQSANITVMDCTVKGNAGHEAITSNHSMNVLLANLKDEASQWHSFGSSHGAMNTVIWRSSYPSTTCFEAHASQPRNTLLDNVTGGLMQNRGGGAIVNMPNHLNGLVFWNYTQTNKPVKDFEFWHSTSIWWKITPPVIAGFLGNGTTFRNDQLRHLEGLDQRVLPASLYAAQLSLRLKKLPDWLQK